MSALRRVGTGFAIGLIAWVGWSVAAVALPSGTVIAVVQSAEVDGQTGKKILQPEAPVFSGDRILTGAIGEAQVKFRDNTKLVVGPNSLMIIDAFVFNDNNTARQISINAVRGAFRFITGNSRKDAYSIRTPTATIGVRGTEFDFNVDRVSGATQLVQFEGATRICRRLPGDDPLQKPRDCILAKDACGLTMIQPNQEIRQVKARAERNIILNRNFRYVLNQQRLLADFRVNTGTCGNISVAVDAPPGSPPGPPPLPPETRPPEKPPHDGEYHPPVEHHDEHHSEHHEENDSERHGPHGGESD